MRKLLLYLVIAGVFGLLAGLWMTRAKAVDPALFAGLAGDVARGAQVYHASGCGSCHADPEATGDGAPVLSGGYRMESPFGTFIAPNISPSPAGIGGWSTLDLANALLQGTAPDGQHYYPSLPYGSYHRMVPQDVVDLKSYLDSLPQSDRPSPPHELGFPFNIRRAVGLWKLLHLNRDWVMAEAGTDQLLRGRYLVEAMGHCAECHTPRGISGGLDKSQWMMGAPNPSGKGSIPAIHPSKLSWSAADIAYYLETGFTPDFDSAGGSMTKVIANLSQLPPEDRAAIAAYLKALP